MPPDPAAFDAPLPAAEPADPDDFNPEPGWRLAPLSIPLLPAPVPVAPELDAPDAGIERSSMHRWPSSP